jgi:hypothetical protein
MMRQILDMLRKDKTLIPDVWHLVANKKLKSEKKTDKHPLDLPKSANKFALISKDRLEALLLQLTDTIDKNTLKVMSKENQCRLACWGIHAEEDSAVPTKIWKEFVDFCVDSHQRTGNRLNNIGFKMDASAKPVPNYAEHGVFRLLMGEDKTSFVKIEHWCGSVVSLKEPLSLDFFVDENFHESRAKVTSQTNMFECSVSKLFVQAKMGEKLFPRLKLERVGDTPKLAICDGEQMLAIENTDIATDGTEGNGEAATTPAATSTSSSSAGSGTSVGGIGQLLQVDWGNAALRPSSSSGGQLQPSGWA